MEGLKFTQNGIGAHLCHKPNPMRRVVEGVVVSRHAYISKVRNLGCGWVGYVRSGDSIVAFVQLIQEGGG